MNSLFLLVLGYQLGERLGLFIGFCLAILINSFLYFFGESRTLAKLEAREINGQDPFGLTELVQKYAQQLNIELPNIYITPHKSANAFAVGSTWKRGALGFTRGLLDRLSPADLEAIIAHQVCHIRKLDSLSVSISSTLANTIVGFGQFLDSFLPYNLAFFKPLLSPVGWIFIKASMNKKAFFLNDKTASELLQNREQLGQVLWRLEGLAQTQPLEIPPCTGHLFVVNPEGFKQRNIFLKSHPPIEERIQRLVGYYPI